MDRKQKILALLESKIESEIVDFKREFYAKEKKYDMIKDIVSFANNTDNNEKYIIFGIDNNFDVYGLNIQEIIDVSAINQLLHEYCEPFINVEVHQFNYKDKDLLALVIAGNVDRPYLIKKQYSKGTHVFLREGEIYIRQGATNFIANRNNLDNIYNNRDNIRFTIKDHSVVFKNLSHGKKNETVCCVPILINNDSKKTLIIHRGFMTWSYPSTSTGNKIEYIEDYQEAYTQELKNIMVSPFQIQPQTQYQKLVFAKVSGELIEVLKLREKENEKLKIIIKLIDASNKEIIFDTVIDSIKCESI